MLEPVIIKNLLTNEEYIRKVLPFIKSEYFETKLDRVILGIISKFFNDYNSLIDASALKVELSRSKEMNESEYKGVIEYISNLPDGDVTQEWLIDSTESWCKKRAVLNGIMESISILEGRSKDRSEDSIPQLLQDALSICFDNSVGHDYLEDAASRFVKMHEEHARIPFDIELLNKITNGGLIRKTMNATIASSGAGKSAFMCHLAAATIKQGYNVLYISMEMSEESVAERVDANMMRINIGDIKDLEEDSYMTKIDKIKSKNYGKLIIKQYPTSGAHSGHFRALMEELKSKKNFKADLVIVDYLNICASSRVKMGASVNSYTYIKFIAEELRGLAVEQDVAMWTATQANRDGYGSGDLEMQNTSECIWVEETVEMRDGTIKKMSQIEFGDQIKDNLTYKTVNMVHHPKTKSCFKITLKSGKKIVVSDKHVFPSNRGRLSLSDGLTVGDKLLSKIKKL